MIYIPTWYIKQRPLRTGNRGPAERLLGAGPSRIAVFELACDTGGASCRFVWSLGKTNQTRNGKKHEKPEQRADPHSLRSQSPHIACGVGDSRRAWRAIPPSLGVSAGRVGNLVRRAGLDRPCRHRSPDCVSALWLAGSEI